MDGSNRKGPKRKWLWSNNGREEYCREGMRGDGKIKKRKKKEENERKRKVLVHVFTCMS